MSTTAAILNQPCPDVTRSFPRQLECSLLCINIHLMNMGGAFSNFASATVGHELKENCIIFRSIISQTPCYPLLGSLLQHWILPWYILCCASSSLFIFFYAKRFTSRLVIAPASRRRSCLSYLHSLYRLFFPPPPSHAEGAINRLRLSVYLIMCVLSPGQRLTVRSSINLCVPSFLP